MLQLWGCWVQILIPANWTKSLRIQNRTRKYKIRTEFGTKQKKQKQTISRNNHFSAVGDRRAGLSVSETADLLGFACTTISWVYREWSKYDSPLMFWWGPNLYHQWSVPAIDYIKRKKEIKINLCVWWLLSMIPSYVMEPLRQMFINCIANIIFLKKDFFFLTSKFQ